MPLQLALEAPVVAKRVRQRVSALDSDVAIGVGSSGCCDRRGEERNRSARDRYVPCRVDRVATVQSGTEEYRTILTLYGGVTTGSLWRFVCLEETLSIVDEREHH